MTDTKIKICGVTTTRVLDQLIALGVEYVGFVHFAKSPRHLDVGSMATLSAHARGKIQTVVVLVNPDNALLTRIADEVQPDFIQLHGTESPARLIDIKQQFGLHIIKAISVENAADIEQAAAYEGIADLLLFDAKTPPNAPLPGGMGHAFDWGLLKNLKKPSSPRERKKFQWLLSGGLTAENIGEAITTTSASIVDVSSGVESEMGTKNPALIEEFVRTVKGNTLG